MNNPGWWAVGITGAVACAGWGAFVARLLWSGRGLLDQIQHDLKDESKSRARIERRLDEHLRWHRSAGKGGPDA